MGSWRRGSSSTNKSVRVARDKPETKEKGGHEAALSRCGETFRFTGESASPANNLGDLDGLSTAVRAQAVAADHPGAGAVPEAGEVADEVVVLAAVAPDHRAVAAVVEPAVDRDGPAAVGVVAIAVVTVVIP